jgi:hypothetical protein
MSNARFPKIGGWFGGYCQGFNSKYKVSGEADVGGHLDIVSVAAQQPDEAGSTLSSSR